MDEEIIIVDRREPPFFMMDNDAIDSRLSLEALAVYAYIQRHGTATREAIRDHFGIGDHHVEIALTELRSKGFVEADDKE